MTRAQRCHTRRVCRKAAKRSAKRQAERRGLSTPPKALLPTVATLHMYGGIVHGLAPIPRPVAKGRPHIAPKSYEGLLRKLERNHKIPARAVRFKQRQKALRVA